MASVGQVLLLWIGSMTIIYVVVVVSFLVFPWSQGILLYGHVIKRPFFSKLKDLKSFSLQHHTRNINILTSDQIILGAWHLLPISSQAVLQHAAVASKAENASPECCSEERGCAYDTCQLHNSGNSDYGTFEKALAAPRQKIVLFFHGQAGTRGTPSRVENAKALAGPLGLHVVSVDYRGFGDSGGGGLWGRGAPSEGGLAEDARAAWAWVARRAHPSAQIFLYGQSLGTHVATRLLHDLVFAKEKHFQNLLSKNGYDHHPAGLILDAPFKNMRLGAAHHPAALPFRLLPPVQRLLLGRLHEPFATDAYLGELAASPRGGSGKSGAVPPVLIFHGRRDRMMPFAVGRALYEEVVAGQRRRRQHRAQAAVSLVGDAAGGSHGSGAPSSSPPSPGGEEEEGLLLLPEVTFVAVAEAGHKNVHTFGEWLHAMGKLVAPTCHEDGYYAGGSGDGGAHHYENIGSGKEFINPTAASSIYHRQDCNTKRNKKNEEVISDNSKTISLV